MSSSVKRFGHFEVDLRARELRRQGVRVRLEEQPFQVLVVLLERPGELVGREELQRRLWPDQTFVDFDRRLNVAVARLRSVLGDSREHPLYIETLYRRGYRFLAPVTDAVEAPLPTAPSVAPAAPTRRSLRPAGLTTLMAGLALTSVVAVASRSTLPAHSVPPSSAVRLRRSVAVLGLQDLSGRPAHAWLSTALSEWLTTELAAGEHLRTVPAPSVARAEIELALSNVDTTAPENLRRLAGLLATDLVVVGSYAVVGVAPDEKIRVDLRLLEAHDGEMLAAVSATGAEADLSALVAEAGATLRAKLGAPPLSAADEVARSAAVPADPRAARLYAQGVARLRHFDALKARDLLQQAVAVQPDHAPSHAALSAAWAELGHDRHAQESAQKALALAPDLPRVERLSIEGLHHERARNWKEAEDVYRALFRFFPDNLEYGLAVVDVQLARNRWPDVLATVGTLRTLPAPLRDDPRIDLAESIAARSIGDYGRAEAAGTRGIARARDIGARLTLAKALLEYAWERQHVGEVEAADVAAREARDIYRAAGHRAGAARATSILTTVALRAGGDSAAARPRYEALLDEYRRLGSTRGVAATHINLGGVLAGLGDLRGALRSFEAALSAYAEAGDPGGVTLARLRLGEMRLLLGDLHGAKNILEQAIEDARARADRTRDAPLGLALAQVLAEADDVGAARARVLGALALLRETGSVSDQAQAEVIFAEILLDQGDGAGAAARAQHAVDMLAEVRGLVVRRAQVAVARALLAQGRADEAQQALARAEAGGHPLSRDLALDVAITSAHLAAASARSDRLAEAQRRLRAEVRASERESCIKCAFDARLALAELDLQAGDLRARSHLRALADEATRRGFHAVGRRAAAVLESL